MNFKTFFSVASISLTLLGTPAIVHAQSGSGLQTTPQGVPWYVASSASRYPGAEAAIRIASSKWRAPWAAKIKSGKISGKFRLVSVNGSTYVVVAKLKEPLLLNAQKCQDLHKKLLRAAVDKAGCTADRNVLVKYSSYKEVEKMAVQVQCSFL